MTYSRIIKRILALVFGSILFLLTSCGSSCYEDPNIGGQSQTYYTKTYSTTISALDSEWTNTGIQLLGSTAQQPLAGTFTVLSASGMASCTKDQNSPGQCAINYSTMCNNGQQYICYDPGTCNNTEAINPCSNQSSCANQTGSCSITNTCEGITGQQMCYNGQSYQYLCYVPTTNPPCSATSDPPCDACDCSNQGPNCVGQWVNTGSNCNEIVSCQNGIKYIGFPYTITNNTGAYSCNDNVQVGTCTAAETNCPYGIPYSVDASNTDWLVIDPRILPGDDIYLKILPPTGNATIPSAFISPSDASLNAWSLNNNWLFPEESSPLCPTQQQGISLTTTQSSFTQCPFLSNTTPGCTDSTCGGYYTCPLCEGQGHKGRPLEGQIRQQCDGSGGDLQCWGVGGSGMWLKIIDASQNCNEVSTCSNGDTNCIWFDQYVTNTISSSVFGIITYQPYTADGPQCGSSNDPDFSYCTNRLTQRHMQGVGDGATQICAKFPYHLWNNNPSMLGGYTVYATHQTCVGYNGLPSAASQVIGFAGEMGLEYIVSNNGTPSSSQYGNLFSNSSTGDLTNLSISSVGPGTLYLRIRDETGTYGDNSGSYNVNIQYTQYSSGGIISAAVEDVRNMIYNMIQTIAPGYFSQLSSDTSQGGFIPYITIMLTLYIIGYGLGFVTGLVQTSQKDFFVRVLKVGLVATLNSNQGWYFFNTYFFSLFFNAMDDLILIAQTGFGGAPVTQGTAVFAFADNMISITVLNPTTWLKLLALSAISPMGLILAALMLIGVAFFVVGVFKAILVYLMSMLVLGILIILAPIFIPFCLFKVTNHLFENWIKAFAHYTLEPVLLIIGLTLLTDLAYVLLIQIINFQVCWKCVWPINFYYIPSITSALNLTETVFCIQFFAPFGMMPSGGSALMSALGLDVVNILLFVIIGHVILGYDKFVAEIVAKITGGGPSSNAGVGSKVLNSTGIPKKVGDFVDKQKTKIKRAAINTLRTSPEDALLKEAGKTEQRYNQAMKSQARNFSDTVAVSLSLNSEGALNHFDTLNDANAPSADKAEAARSLGMGLYNTMSFRGDGDSDESYQNRQTLKGQVIGSFSKLASIEEDSEAYKKLSPAAKELREALIDKDSSAALKVLNDKDSTEEEKRGAMGDLASTIYDKKPDAHKILFNPVDADQRANLMEEMMRLERLPDSSIKRPSVK